jgi:hypothetical protein
MGVFDTRCALSGVALVGNARAIFLARTETGWKPVATAIAGRYDQYGGIEEIDEQDRIALATASGLAATLEFDAEPADASLSGILTAIHEADAHYAEHDIRFALVDSGVYEASVAGASSDASLTQLFDTVLASGVLARELYAGLGPELEAVLRQRLIELTKLGSLEPFDLDLCSQFEEEHVREFAAEAKRNHPALGNAIDANLAEWETVWRQDN